MWLKMGPVSTDVFSSEIKLKKKKSKWTAGTQTTLAFLFIEALVQMAWEPHWPEFGASQGSILPLGSQFCHLQNIYISPDSQGCQFSEATYVGAVWGDESLIAQGNISITIIIFIIIINYYS